MPTKEYKKNYCDLDKFEQSLCLGLFAIDYKLDHCNSEYIEEQFLKSDVCQDYVRKAQKLFDLSFEAYSLKLGRR